jgi:hypothetical protein
MSSYTSIHSNRSSGREDRYPARYGCKGIVHGLARRDTRVGGDGPAGRILRRDIRIRGITALSFLRRITVEVDGASSLITEVESGRDVAVVSKPFQRVAGKRLIYRQIMNCTAVHKVGIARAVKSDLTPAGDKWGIDSTLGQRP